VPIINFGNKLDREGRDPFDLIDEIEQTLALGVTSTSWASGATFLASMTCSPMRSSYQSAGPRPGHLPV
jgi:peptide subunit release factor RF-3